MKLIDIHCHLESEEFQGRITEIVREAEDAGIVKMITASVAPNEWEVSLGLAAEFGSVECVLGVHPWYCHEEHLSRLDDLSSFLSRGAIGIGEAGLDTKTDITPFLLQQSVFEKQLAIACELNVPMVLHCRGAFNEMLDSFKKIGVPERGGVIHNFTGSSEVAARFMDYDMSFSLGGILTYRNSRKRNEMLCRIYPDHFLLETDSPDIPPVEARERPNVPANILHNLRAASEILGVEQKDIAQTCLANCLRIFRIP